MAKKILVVLTSHAKDEASGMATGWYLPEFAHPYYVLAPHCEFVIASPRGGPAPISPDSVTAYAADPESASFLADHSDLWSHTLPLASFLGRSAEFDAIFYPGGHGPDFDLYDDPASIQLIAEFYAAGKPVAAVCHGPIVFAKVEINGVPLVKDKEVTGFTNEEEDIVGWTKNLPVLVETALLDQGARFVKAEKPWEAKVVRDGNLISGQNPNSARPMGEELLKALQ